MDRRRIVSRVFHAKDYNLALAEKERTGAIMRRIMDSTNGPMYEVIYLPPERSPYRDITANEEA